MSTILVLNMGMKSIRSILFDEEGSKLAASSLPIETSLKGETVTQNPAEWWEKTCMVIKESLSDAGHIPVDYLTVTASSSCLVCVDGKGDALFPCMMVSDKRAKEESGTLERLLSFPKVKKQTGLQADASLMLPKALWMKNREGGIFQRTMKLLSPNDFLIAKFTGRYATDYMNAHKWYYDAEEKSYPRELLQEAGIPEAMLPEVLIPGSFVGNIIEEAAEQTGLTIDTKVILSTYDAICSFVGSGTMQEGEASDVSGTVTVLRAASSKKMELTENRIQQIPYYEGGMYIIGGSNNMGGGLIEWVKQCYYQNEQLPYELMERDAGEASIGAGGVIFLPYLLGERTPIWDSDARGVFFGLERMHTRKEMTRAVFESTGFIDLDMIAAIEEAGITIDSIRLSGGLARINLISQLKADITGRKIQVLSEFETTATGAAMIALYGQNVYSSLQEAAGRFAKVRMVICPDMKNHEKYKELYFLYKETYQTLKPLFPKRIKMTEQLYRNKRIRIENL
ncbi:MAG: FGGY family carbohydrate kinase [Blautia sp.]|nr:FGGY family carbohydrate kinase [Blautia sp.]MCM1200792.1 FGGY family carbohydrate kinase [Bacteroides fragilis]